RKDNPLDSEWSVRGKCLPSAMKSRQSAGPSSGAVSVRLAHLGRRAGTGKLIQEVLDDDFLTSGIFSGVIPLAQAD
ncbi:MAG: hypothetical protein ACK517_02790, partial [bacterium]